MRLIFFALAAALAILFAAGAWAEQTCARRAAVLEQLAERYGERLVAQGITIQGVLIEILAAPNGKTFTIIVTLANGVSCLVAVGEHWETGLQQPEGDDS